MITATTEHIQKAAAASKKPIAETLKEFFPYVCVWSADGVEHTFRGFAPKSMDEGLRLAHQTIDHLSANTPDQENKLIAYYFDVSKEEEEKIIAESSAKNPDQATTDPLILHKSQGEVVG